MIKALLAGFCAAMHTQLRGLSCADPGRVSEKVGHAVQLLWSLAPSRSLNRPRTHLC